MSAVPIGILLALSTGCQGVLGLVRVSDRTPDAPVADAAIDTPWPEPVMYFPFDDNRRDQISNSLATCGSGLNCPTFGVGKHGDAAQFNGAGTCLLFDPATQLGLTHFTVAVWINDSTDTSYSVVAVPYMSSNTGKDSWQIDTDTGSTVRFVTNGSAPDPLPAPGALPLQAWHHVAVTDDGMTKRIYVDGMPVASNTQASVLYDTVVLLTIGCDMDNGNYDRFFAGSLDDLYVFDSALDQSIIGFLAAP